MESYSKQVGKQIDDVVNSYILDVSNKYNIDKKDLKLLWTSCEGVKEVVKSSNDDKGVYESNLMKKSKKELVELCVKSNLNVKGAKKDLASRLVNHKYKKDNIVDNITKNMNAIIIKKNQWGNYEHSLTKLIFNKTTKTVFGKQNDDGNVIKLTREDIEMCNKYKFKYNIPLDLSSEAEAIDLDDEISESDEEFEEEEEEED